MRLLSWGYHRSKQLGTSFWVRLGTSGPVLEIHNKDAFKLFSERYGYTKFYYLGPIKFGFFKS